MFFFFDSILLSLISLITLFSLFSLFSFRFIIIVTELDKAFTFDDRAFATENILFAWDKPTSEVTLAVIVLDILACFLIKGVLPANWLKIAVITTLTILSAQLFFFIVAIAVTSDKVISLFPSSGIFTLFKGCLDKKIAWWGLLCSGWFVNFARAFILRRKAFFDSRDECFIVFNTEAMLFTGIGVTITGNRGRGLFSILAVFLQEEITVVYSLFVIQ